MTIHLAQALLLLAGSGLKAFLLLRLVRESQNAPFAPLILSAANRYDSVILLLASILVWRFTQALEFILPGHAILLLSEMGIQTALEDFGTGFASLGYLHSLPFDTV